MRYFFYHWYRPLNYGGVEADVSNEQTRMTVVVDITPKEAQRLCNMQDEFSGVVDSDDRPAHQATMRRIDFSQAALAYNRIDQRIYPLLGAWSLDTNSYKGQAARMATRMRNLLTRLEAHDGTPRGYQFCNEGWVLVPTVNCGKLFPYTMTLCDFTFTAGGIQIVTSFGVTMPLPWRALSGLGTLAPQEEIKIRKHSKRQTVLVR